MSEPYRNVYSVLENTVSRLSQQAAYFVRSDNQWQAISWENYKQQVDYFAMSLLSYAFDKGDRLCILAGNCLAWPVADLGTIAAGGISIGLYPTSSAEQCAYILNHSESAFIVVDSLQQYEKILGIQTQVPSLKKIIITFPLAEYSGNVIAWNDFLQSGKDFIYSAEGFIYSAEGSIDFAEGSLHPAKGFPRSSKAKWQKYQTIAHASAYEDIVIIVYTSGTTGDPKGACLSNRYVLASVQALDKFLLSVIHALPEQQQQEIKEQPFISLSFLPYCHVAERISGMYTRLYRGDAAYLVDDFSQLASAIQDAQPHGFGGLPRIYEKLYAGIMQQVDSREGFDRKIFLAAIETNKSIKKLQTMGEPIPESLQQQFNQAEQQVYSKVRAYFGERILYCSSGAAPLPEKVLELFEYAGNIHILEAYGLTEFVCCAFNTPQAHRANSVGKPMLGCEVQIADDGEILLKGPQIFSGYYRDKKATQEAIDPQGWLHSGDIGRVDGDGYLYITGRKKEFIKTSTGKKISPLLIENLCKRNHLISNVLVYGDNKSYLIALITLNAIELCTYAKQHYLDYQQYADLTQHPQIQTILAEVIDGVNKRVSRTEQIKKYRILEQDFSISRNEITPTGKIKRNYVTKHYAAQIESMYQT